MAGINVGETAREMADAAKAVLGANWSTVKGYAEMEFKKIAQTMAEIEKMQLTGRITKEQARLLLDLQKHSSRVLMLTLETMGIVAVEKAINAALGAVRDTVNKALGWALL